MKREHKQQLINNNWKLIVDCPFNGNKTNNADSGIVLSGTGSFVTDPITGSNQVARFTSDSHRFFIELTDFAKQDTGRCKIELDFLCYNHSTPTYPNIMDNSKSGNAGIFTQREGSFWKFGITNKGYDVSQSPGFLDQVLIIDTNSIPLNQWMHLSMERYESIEKVQVTLGSSTLGFLERTDVGQFNAALNSLMGRLAIGGSYGWSRRYLNGCIKNLKIYLYEA